MPALLVSFFLSALRSYAVTPQAYDTALGRVQTAIVAQTQALRAETVPSGEAPSLVAQRELLPIRSVEVPGFAPQPVDASRLVDEVRSADALNGPAAKASALEALNNQITMLRQSMAHSARPGVDRSSADIIGSVRNVLSGDEFASDPPAPPSAAERAAAWLDRWLAKIFKRPAPTTNFAPLPTISPLILQVVFVTIALAAFGVLVYVLVQALGRRGARPRPLALAEEEETLVEARDTDSLLALAEKQAGIGDFRRAFRLVYLAALVALDTGGVLRFDRSKTNWEYLRALRAAGRSDVYDVMTPLTREFDQVWYGFSRTDASNYTRALAQYHAMLSASPTAVPQSQKPVSV